MTLLGRLSALCERQDLDALYVFGSRAAEVAAFVRGQGALDPASGADVDLGALPRPHRRLDVHDRVQLTSELEELLGVPRVDLVLLPQVGPYLALDVVSGELLVSADPVRESEYELYVLRRAGDLAFYERERRHQLLGRSHPVTPGGIKEKVVADRVRWIDDMLRGIRALPLESYERFASDPRNIAKSSMASPILK